MPGLRTGEAPGSRGDLRRDARVPNATRFPSAETTMIVRLWDEPPSQSAEAAAQPRTAQPHSPADPVPPLPAGNASHAALHRPALLGLPRPTSGGRSRPPGDSVSVVSRSLRGDQARKRSGPSGSASGRTTKATGRFAFPEERNLRAERPILGAMARRARTEGWVQRHLAVGGTQGPPVARTPFPSLWTLLLARIQNVSNLDDADDEI